MSGVASLLAVALAAVFAFAAVLKVRDRSGTTTDFAELGLPAARHLAIAVPLAEIGVAAALLVVPGWGATAAFVMLAAFTTLLAGVVRSGRVVSCACFGATSEPVSATHLVRNALLIAWTVPVLTIEHLTRPSSGEILLALVLLVGPVGLFATFARVRD